MGENVNQAIRRLLATRDTFHNRDLAETLGISRQAVHKHLRALVAKGELVREGAGRGAYYRRPVEGARHYAYPTAGLREDRVWADVVDRTAVLSNLPADAADLFHYAVTELVNNAIDHSGAQEVEVVVESAQGRLVVEVIDAGVGIFEHLRERLGLASHLEALQELSKGKTTTDPERHTGEGIFFVSKGADQFEIESGSLLWLVDNLRDEMAVAQVDPPRTGTRVRFAARPASPRNLRGLFDEYTDNYQFTRTRTVIRLFAIGVRFVSRSEAKRLVHGLEKFRQVTLDFAGVTGVGQGFCDEVFRVWARSHPETRLEPVNMCEPVAFMVERALHHP